MLTEKELDSSSAQVAEFRLANTQQHDSLTQILEKYETIVEDYKRLKSDYEEERDSRERYKQMARRQERNPFVLVLVDGDGYVFDDDLVSNGGDGGQRAAQLLDDEVKRSLRDRGLDQCRIMVRIYANLVGLSKVLSRVKLAGPEKRSLAPFTASFTRSNDLFDFVDAGELKENADFKIRALFRQFVENPQCKHIYFAGCHDVGYINELTPHASNRDRITLIRHPAFHQEFSKLGMRIEDFPNIFRSTPLDGQYSNYNSTKQIPAPSSYKAVSAPPADPARNAPQEPAATGQGQRVCKFFQTNSCKYGKSCHNLHIKESANGQTNSTFGDLNEIKKWRETAQPTASLPFHLSNLAKSDNDFMSGHHARGPSFGSNSAGAANNDTVQSQIEFAAKLPSTVPEGKVPVNAEKYRLDIYIPPVSAGEVKAFERRTAIRKLCNNHHVQGYCPYSAEECVYDHDTAPEGVLNTLRHVVASNPCPRKGACRRLKCPYGHVCQKADCKNRGGRYHCKFPPYVHGQDLSVAAHVDGDAPKGTGLNDRSRDQSVNGSGSGSTPRAESEGDGEQDRSEGALLDVGDDALLD